MSDFLLDTHIWLWAMEDSPRLPTGVRREIDESPATCWLSPVSVWELGLLASRGRYRLDAPLRTWLEDADRAYPLREAAFTKEVALVAHEIVLRTRDPVDHFLAATALVYDLTLMTVDNDLIGLEWLPTRSD